MADLETRLQRAETKVLAKGVLMDRCQVLRDPERLDDDTLDLVTGELQPAAGDTTVLWTGQWALRPQTTGPDVAQDADQHADRPRDPRYEGLLPRSCPPLTTTDRIVCLSSRLDPQLTGRQFRLRERPELSTFLVLRAVPLEIVP